MNQESYNFFVRMANGHFLADKTFPVGNEKVFLALAIKYGSALLALNNLISSDSESTDWISKRLSYIESNTINLSENKIKVITEYSLNDAICKSIADKIEYYYIFQIIDSIRAIANLYSAYEHQQNFPLIYHNLNIIEIFLNKLPAINNLVHESIKDAPWTVSGRIRILDDIRGAA